MKQIIINCEQLQTRIAVSVEGRLEEYQVENRGDERIVGSIYKGRIRNLEASLQAAFVDIGMEKNAFLHYWDMVPATKEMLEMEGTDDSESNDGDTNDESNEDIADDAQGGDQGTRNGGPPNAGQAEGCEPGGHRVEQPASADRVEDKGVAEGEDGAGGDAPQEHH